MLDPIRKTNVISPHIQKILWEQPPTSSNKHVAGKLKLCVGLPVMLKHNDVIECCMTKGAEATVVSWQMTKGPEGQDVLDTLFIKLKDPPKTIKIDGLMENVVPITRHTTVTMCSLPNDDEISLSRDQVLVLSNFAMTDYSSQGRTRPDNVVDLNSCWTHQSYYTCLSRSASAGGTIIVQGFDPRVVTGGASGYLRQEFWELEILDEVTRLRYENKLPESITGDRQNIVIRQFQQRMGTEYVPDNVHPSIRWNKQDPLNELAVTTDTPWQLVKNTKGANKKELTSTKSNTTGFVAARGTVPVSTDISKKRKLYDDDDHVQANKKIKMSEENNAEPEHGPQGLIWDGQNYSCAYDSVMTILLSIWSQNPVKWKRRFKDMNRTMNVLASGFYKAKEEQMTLETARNKVRHLLHQRNPTLFPNGQVGTTVSEMTEQLLRSDNVIASNWICCIDCGHQDNLNRDLQTCVLQCNDIDVTTSVCLQKRFEEKYPRRKCEHCDGALNKIMRFDIMPDVLVFSVSEPSIQVSKKVTFCDGYSLMVFGLKWVVYHGDFHYTARVCTDGSVWFHDGMVSGHECIYEKRLTEFTGSELSTCKGKLVSLVIYARS